MITVFSRMPNTVPGSDRKLLLCLFQKGIILCPYLKRMQVGNTLINYTSLYLFYSLYFPNAHKVLFKYLRMVFYPCLLDKN